MGLLTRSKPHKREANDDSSSEALTLHSDQNIEIVGLHNKAKQFLKIERGESLLTHANNLRQSLEKNLGLRAQAEQFRQKASSQDSNSPPAHLLTLALEPSALSEETSPFETNETKQQEKESLVSPERAQSPENFHKQLSLQRQIKMHHIIFDILRALQKSSDSSSFWDTLMYAVIAQLGSKKILILADKETANDNYFYPVRHSGFDSMPEWQFDKTKGLLRYLSKRNRFLQIEDAPNFSILYKEKKSLKEAGLIIAIAIESEKKIDAVILLSSSISQDEYTKHDIQFLQLLTELSYGSYAQIKAKQENKTKQETSSSQKIEAYQSIIHLTQLLHKLKTKEELYELLQRYLKEQLNVTSYALVLLDTEQEAYRIFHAKNLSKTSQKKFKLSKQSSFITSLSNFLRIYHINDFQETPEILSCYQKNDIKKMQRHWVLPLVYREFLTGFIAVYHIEKSAWSKLQCEIALSITELITPYLVTKTIEQQAEKFQIYEQNIEIRIKQEWEECCLLNLSLGMLNLRISNLSSLIKSMNLAQYNAFFSKLNQSLVKTISSKERIYRLSPCQFAIFLHGKNRNQTKQWTKNLLLKLPTHISQPKKKKIYYTYNIDIFPRRIKKGEKMGKIFS